MKKSILCVVFALLLATTACVSTNSKHSEDSADNIDREVLVSFEKSVPMDEARKVVESYGAEILYSSQYFKYFRVRMNDSNSAKQLIASMKSNNKVSCVVPNQYLVPCSANVFIIDDTEVDDIVVGGDNKSISHGDMVEYTLQSNNSGSTITTYNAYDSERKGIYRDEISKGLEYACKHMSDDELNIVNISLGVRMYKDDKKTIKKSRDEYMQDYADNLIWYADIINKCENKNFVITKSMGNEYEYNIDEAFIRAKNMASSEQLKAIEDHFVFVAAKDTRKGLDKNYSNTISQRVEGFNTIMVDISDLPFFQNGTSAAAPLVANWISRSGLKKAEDVIEVINKAITNGELVSENGFQAATRGVKRAKRPKRQGWDGGEEQPLYGDIESVVITKYKLAEKSGEIVKDKILSKTAYKFNQKGDVIEKVNENNSDGSLRWNYLYKYDSQGNMIEETSYNSYGSLDRKWLTKYDYQGNEIEVVWYNPDGLPIGRHACKYDSQGNEIEEVWYEPDGSLSSKTIYKYDSQGNKVEKIEYDTDGSWKKTLYKYDSQGNKIEQDYYNSDGWFLSKVSPKYDSQGNLIEVAEYKRDGALASKVSFKYDSHSNVVKAIVYEGEKMTPKYMEVREIVYREGETEKIAKDVESLDQTRDVNDEPTTGGGLNTTPGVTAPTQTGPCCEVSESPVCESEKCNSNTATKRPTVSDCKPEGKGKNNEPAVRTNEESKVSKRPKAPKRQGWVGGPLYGDVESETSTRYTVSEKFGEIVKDKITFRTFYRFNQKGDVIEWAWYNSDGSLDWKYTYKYDSQGNQIEEAEYKSDGSLNGKYTYTYKYDSQGNMIEKTYYNSDGSLYCKHLYKYDSQGNQIEWAWYNSDGSLDWKLLYKYDSQGNMIEEAEYKSDGSLDWKATYKYDSQGNMIEKTYYNYDGSLRGKTIYKYDSQGNWVEWISYEGEIMKPTEMVVRKIVYRK